MRRRRIYDDLEFKLGNVLKGCGGVYSESSYCDAKTGELIIPSATHEIVMPKDFDIENESDLKSLVHEIEHYVMVKKFRNTKNKMFIAIVDLAECFTCPERQESFCKRYNSSIWDMEMKLL